MGVKSSFIVVLIRMSLMANDAEQLFMCLSDIRMSSLEKISVWIFCPFLFFHCLVVKVLHIF